MFNKAKNKKGKKNSRSKQCKDNSNNKNINSLEENENIQNLEKNNTKSKKETKKKENIIGSKKNREKEGNSSSLSTGKKKKKCSKKDSGYSADSESESDSIEKKTKKKDTKKKNLISKKEKKLDNESNSSSSSNYHPEDHNYLAELLPFMSSDSEDEISIEDKRNISKKSNKDEIKKEKTKENLDKKSKSVKKDEKENEIKNEKNIEKSRTKKDKIENIEEKKENIEILELNEKYNNTKNINSINYYTKKVKINKKDELPSYDFIELKNSDDILYGKETKKIYDCKNKKEKLNINYKFDYEIIPLKDNYFIYVDCYDNSEIIIFHFEEFNTKMIIDQKMDLPENIEYDEYGPAIAPYLFCIPLNENYIIFMWSRNNNFYIYKNNSKEKNKIKFEEYENIKLDKEAFVYINTSLERILKINDNEFCIFSKSTQIPEARFLFEAFMSRDKKHKEATYIAVYSFNSSKGKFELKRSKLNYEKGVDYGFEINLLRKRFLFYDGRLLKSRENLVQVFDLETMQIIYILKNNKIKYYPISDNNDIFFIIKNDNIYEQYQVYHNGVYKQIGEVKLQNVCIERKYKNGILCKGKKDYYFLTHE